MKSIKKKSQIIILFYFLMLIPFNIYANPWFGWHSNNDCTPVATPSDSYNQSACIGGTESLYIFGIKVSTRSEPERYGSVSILIVKDIKNNLC